MKKENGTVGADGGSKIAPVEFAALSDEQKQSWVDFRQSEIEECLEKVKRYGEELGHIRKRYGIIPRHVFLASWVIAPKEHKDAEGG